ncbi:BrnT family toxin [Aquabacter sp. CN5-332]|uniref:BrnT family toxin n=1 Tax=Aquabacter sp. CN5-332 TaxID=3156608 RepID=UPI0032B55CAF
MIITWDERKRQANVDKHGLDFSLLNEEFFQRAIILPAKLGRRMAIGQMDDGTVVVIFLRLGTEGLSVISMRRPSAQERRLLDEQSKD